MRYPCGQLAAADDHAAMPRLHGRSATRFLARWLALTGLAPQAWIRGRRLVTAAALLRAGLTLEAAAMQVGYAKAGALFSALRRERGVGARGLRALAACRKPLDKQRR